ncbi:MAG TPA: hypothetical protein VLE97_06525 [Gaiellaceae bacterium]|nr:hypothetical protein [Gaiellaceae bacterium]
MTEDKVQLTRQRAELIEKLSTQIPTDTRVRIQGELALINAKIKAINTTTAAKLKADADRRRVAGLAEAQANAARARANAGLSVGLDFEHHFRDDLACPACGTDSSVGCVAGAGSEDDDPGQTSAIDSWIDAVLLRHDVEFTRSRGGKLTLPAAPAVLLVLIDGIYAAARGQELPDLPATPAKAEKPPKAAAKQKKR